MKKTKLLRNNCTKHVNINVQWMQFPNLLTLNDSWSTDILLKQSIKSTDNQVLNKATLKIKIIHIGQYNREIKSYIFSNIMRSELSYGDTGQNPCESGPPWLLVHLMTWFVSLVQIFMCVTQKSYYLYSDKVLEYCFKHI